MGVLTRIRYVVKGKAEAILDHMEKPEEQLAVFVNELNDQMTSLQKAVARAIADEKRLKMEIEDRLAEAAEWEKRAVLALENGDEELAKQALVKKEEHDTRVQGLEKTWKAQQAATAKLKANLQSTKERIDEAKRKYTLMVAQYKTAETTKRVNESLSANASTSPMVMMEKLGDKIRTIEAETEAAAELSGASADVDLEAKFATLERGKRGGQALDALKAKLAAKTSQPNTPER
ncbi:MAG: PspA/IM30 family protein [Candidatus Binatia bacterium]